MSGTGIPRKQFLLSSIYSLFWLALAGCFLLNSGCANLRSSSSSSPLILQISGSQNSSLAQNNSAQRTYPTQQTPPAPSLQTHQVQRVPQYNSRYPNYRSAPQYPQQQYQQQRYPQYQQRTWPGRSFFRRGFYQAAPQQPRYQPRYQARYPQPVQPSPQTRYQSAPVPNNALGNAGTSQYRAAPAVPTSPAPIRSHPGYRQPYTVRSRSPYMTRRPVSSRMPPSRLLGELSSEINLLPSVSGESSQKLVVPIETPANSLAQPFGSEIEEPSLSEFGTESDSEVVEFGTPEQPAESQLSPFERAPSNLNESPGQEPPLLTIEEDEFGLDDELFSSRNLNDQSLISPNPEPASPETLSSPFGPQLGLDTTSRRDDLKIEIRQEEQVQVGNGALFEVFVINEGTESFDRLKLNAAFGSELFLPGRQTRDLGQKIPQLDPAQKMKIPLTLFSETPGRHCVRFRLLNEEGKEIAGNSSCVEFIPEVVQLKLTGPEICSVESPASYLLEVRNLSDRPLSDVRVDLLHDSVLELQEATGNPQMTSNGLFWKVPQIQAGRSEVFEVTFDCKTVSDNSSLVLKAHSPGHPQGTAASFLKIERPLSPVDISFSSQTSHVQPDRPCTFRIRCQNRGLKSTRDGVITVQFPDGARYQGHRWEEGQGFSAGSEQIFGQEITIALPEPLETAEEKELEIQLVFDQTGTYQLPVQFSSRENRTQMDRIHYILVSDKTPLD